MKWIVGSIVVLAINSGGVAFAKDTLCDSCRQVDTFVTDLDKISENLRENGAKQSDMIDQGVELVDSIFKIQKLSYADVKLAVRLLAKLNYYDNANYCAESNYNLIKSRFQKSANFTKALKELIESKVISNAERDSLLDTYRFIKL
jgi:predicted nucleotidyltransferase component of viral defense system